MPLERHCSNHRDQMVACRQPGPQGVLIEVAKGSVNLAGGHRQSNRRGMIEVSGGCLKSESVSYDIFQDFFDMIDFLASRRAECRPATDLQRKSSSVLSQ